MVVESFLDLDGGREFFIYFLYVLYQYHKLICFYYTLYNIILIRQIRILRNKKKKNVQIKCDYLTSVDVVYVDELTTYILTVNFIFL